MSIPWELRIYRKQELLDVVELEGPAELGRQDLKEHEPGPPEHAPTEGEARAHVRRLEDKGCWRVVVAHHDEVSVPRSYVRVEPMAGGKVRVTNLHEKVKLSLASGELGPSATQELNSPVVFQFGKRTARVQALEPEQEPLEHLDAATIPPGRLASPPPISSLLGTVGQAVKPEALLEWFQGILVVMQSAAGSPDFFTRAARAVVDLVQMDSAVVLLYEKGGWTRQTVQAEGGEGAGPDWRPSQHILHGLAREKRTVWRAPQTGSLDGVEVVVAAPILDARGAILGALYGERRLRRGAAAARAITRLEAMLVELLASGVAAGLARLDQERAVIRARVQFEQFFTPELSRQLEAHPDLLQGRDAEVTVLFCDIRAFSRHSERLGPKRTVEWIGDALGALSECVLSHRGVLVDYIGDELMAMWGAPERQPDHAALACQAALEMLERLPELNDRWEPVLEAPMGLGIGINSGTARVGNVGTRRKFKYGPLGNTVNLASRVQGATKFFRTRALITRTTREQLGPDFLCRRLCRVRVVNIAEPVEIYQLSAGAGAEADELHARYEEALARFERQSFHTAVRLLGDILNEHPDDGPSLVLLSRAVERMMHAAGEFDSVWELPGK